MIERLVRSLPAIAWMAFIFSMSSREQFPQPFGMSTFLLSIAAHMFLYGVLATLLLLAFEPKRGATRSTLIAAVTGAVLFGISDEFHQSFVPGRDASVFDVVVDAIGSVIAVSVWTQFRSVFATVTSR